MLKTTKLLTAILAAATIAGCGFFRVEIQQGNFITQEQVEQLEPGMNKREVRYVMGTPLVVDPFHEKRRWDYVYSYSPDLGSEFERRRITLFFDGDTLTRIDGDLEGTELAEVHQETGGTRITEPTGDEGFFKKIFTGKDEPAGEAEAEDSE